MKRRKLLFLVCVAFLTTSCYTISVNHDYNSEADFSSLKTFDWMKDPKTAMSNVPASLEKNTLLDKRVRNAVNRQLAARGLKQDAADPDFLVVYYISVKDKLRSSGSRYHSVHVYQEGTLILDFVERDTMDIIWRGIAKRTVESNPTPDKMERNINNAVEKLFTKFPP